MGNNTNKTLAVVAFIVGGSILFTGLMYGGANFLGKDEPGELGTYNPLNNSKGNTSNEEMGNNNFSTVLTAGSVTKRRKKHKNKSNKSNKSKKGKKR